MKNFILWLSSILTLASTPQVVTAQNTTSADEPNVDLLEMDIVSNKDGADVNIYTVLNENAPEEYRSPKLPKFAIIGKDKRFYMGIGGYVRGTVAFDFGNPLSNPTYFIPSDITRQTNGNGGRTQMSAGTTNLFFSFVSLPGQRNQIGAYIDFNFDKDQYDIDLRHAYLTWREFSAGYSYTLFYDQNCVPMTVDFEGAPSLTSIRTSFFAWNSVCHNWTFGIALETPIFSATESSTAEIVNQRMPCVPMYVKYNWDKDSYTRIGGILRSIQYRNLVADQNRNRFGFGVQLTGVQKVFDMIDVYYQGLYGDGIADYLIDLHGMNLDVVPDHHRLGRLKDTQTFAYLGGIKITYNKYLSSNHMYSQVRSFIERYDEPSAFARLGGTYSVVVDKLIPWDNQYKYGQYLCNNIFYTHGQLQIGLEYIWGARRNMDHLFAHNNRLQFMAQINF